MTNKKRHSLYAGALLTLFSQTSIAAEQNAVKSELKQNTQKTEVSKNQESTALVFIQDFIAKQKIDKTNKRWKLSLPQPPKATFSQSKNYFWDLKTNQGDISIKFYPEYAPMHVTSTMYLTELGFYNDVIFHRVIPGFMAQGGDPTGTGRGGPGYKYAGEYHKNATHTKAGMLSMANAGQGTDGSQFFITFKETRYLDGRHTVFGEVVSGLDDTLIKIESQGTGGRGKTKSKIIILEAKIRVESKKKN